jgi:hypothetical protein
VGGHALTPPTDHRLGRPLPHQLPNPPQAHPEAPFGFTRQTESPSTCGISPAFAGLFPTSGQVTYVLRTRLPLTLSRKTESVRLTCIKHAASVHPEPGSNSPYYFTLAFSGLGSNVDRFPSYHSSVVKVPPSPSKLARAPPSHEPSTSGTKAPPLEGGYTTNTLCEGRVYGVCLVSFSPLSLALKVLRQDTYISYHRNSRVSRSQAGLLRFFKADCTFDLPAPAPKEEAVSSATEKHSTTAFADCQI